MATSNGDMSHEDMSFCWPRRVYQASSFTSPVVFNKREFLFLLGGGGEQRENTCNILK